MKSVFIALLSASFQLHATALIAVRWNDGIVIGSDSKQRHLDGAPGRPACKIIPANDVFFAYAGISESSTLGSTDSLAASAMYRDGSILSRIGRFEADITPKLLVVAQGLQKDYPKLFATRILNKSMVEILFATIPKHEVPKLFLRAFFARICDGHVVIQTVEKDCPGKNFGPSCYFALGHHEVFDEEIAAHPKTVFEPTVVEAVRRLLRFQAKRTPASVGGEFTIVFLEPTKTTWVEPGLCPQHK